MITVEEFVERLCRVGADRGPRRFPRKQRDREIMMKSIRLVIDHERTYSEPEINDVIRVWRREVAPAIDTDHVNIRRMLTDHGHLERTADGRFYRLGFPARPIAFDLEVDTIDVRATVAAYRQRGGGPPAADPEVNALLDTWLAGACEVLGGTLTVKPLDEGGTLMQCDIPQP